MKKYSYTIILLFLSIEFDSADAIACECGKLRCTSKDEDKFDIVANIKIIRKDKIYRATFIEKILSVKKGSAGKFIKLTSKNRELLK